MRALLFVQIIPNCLHLNNNTGIQRALLFNHRQRLGSHIGFDANRFVSRMGLYFCLDLFFRHVQELGNPIHDFRLDGSRQRQQRYRKSGTVLHDAQAVPVKKRPARSHRRDKARPVAVGPPDIFVALIDLKITRPGNQKHNGANNQAAQNL